ncbi:hypothetical protein P3X46_018282 [Hevea brasiliensis]|uniref:DUF4371 domain-containing protein n=1 Tax=Hevea brasiliensis TaxID=3981 RepID=A0ABQ9LUE7_HEVBR|nr:hypothetical protein P3X46_018282 [Hevea brasiliensis]
MNQAQYIEVSFSKQSEQTKIEYRCRLNASIICLCYFLMQGLTFPASCNEEINNVVLKSAPDNLRLISPDIQKDIINAVATETTQAIIIDLGDDLFSILLDECRDVLVKEQMEVVIRCRSGCVIERFIGLVHVHNTNAASLKKCIGSLLSTYGLSEFNGLKSLILKDNSSTYYIHCCAYQLQLTLVAVAKKHSSISSFFNIVTHLVNVIGDSCKRRDMLREKQLEKVFEGIAKCDTPYPSTV